MGHQGMRFTLDPDGRLAEVFLLGDLRHVLQIDEDPVAIFVQHNNELRHASSSDGG